MTSLPVKVAIKVTVLLGAAGVVQLMSRRASAAARHLVWALAIAGVLVLPLASAWLPPLTLAIPVEQTAVTSAAPSTTLSQLGAGTNATPLASSLSDVSAPAVDSSDTGLAIAWPVLIPAVYIGGVLLLLARLALERLALRRVVRIAHPVTDTAWRQLLDDCVRRMRCRQPIRLLQSDADVMPMTFGSRHATIIVPRSADAWTDDRRRAVLMHELAHVTRRDCLTQAVGSIARALYWPHPGIWWAARRLHVECELACDDRVLAMGTEARDYAVHLLEIARSFTAAPSIALGMARVRQLEGRLIALLDDARNRSAFRRAVGIVSTITAMFIVVPIAAFRATVVPVQPRPMTTVAYAPQSSSARPQVQAASSSEGSGTWDVYLEKNTSTVHLTMRTTNSSHGHSLPLSRLEGLTAAQVTSDGRVHFVSRREAGTFTFEGVCGRGVCGGTYTFAPSASFAAELAKRGIGTPTDAQMVRLAMADTALALLDELKAGGYGGFNVDGLVRLADHGVDVEYVHELSGLGYRLGTIDELVRLRDHGVDPEFVRGMNAEGLAKLSADDLVRARDHGVDPEFVRGMRGLDYKASSLDEFVRFRDHGVDPDFVRDLASQGLTKLSANDLVLARDHGVDAEFARGLRDAGQKSLSLDQLVKARDHGVDPAFARELGSLGYKDISLDDLARLRDHGVDPAYVRRLQSRGSGHLTVDELIRRRDSGGDEDYVKALFDRAQALWHSLLGRMRG